MTKIDLKHGIYVFLGSFLILYCEQKLCILKILGPHYELVTWNDHKNTIYGQWVKSMF